MPFLPACRLWKAATFLSLATWIGLLTFDGPEPLSLQPGDGVLILVKREGGGLQDGSLCEAVLPVEGQVEAIPGVWDTGAVEGSILVAALDADLTLEPGDVVAEVRAGCVDVCGCGSIETFFTSAESAPVYESCGLAGLRKVRRHATPADPLIGLRLDPFKGAMPVLRDME